MQPKACWSSMFNVIQTQRASQSMLRKVLFGLVIVEYIFAAYLWLSSCLRSASHSLFPSLRLLLSCISLKCMTNYVRLDIENCLSWISNFVIDAFASPMIYIYSSLFVIRLQSFLSKDLWEKYILRTSGPGILQLSVMPSEVHRGSLFYIKCLKQGMLIESIWNWPVTDGEADIKLGRTSPNPVCVSLFFSLVRV